MNCRAGRERHSAILVSIHIRHCWRMNFPPIHGPACVPPVSIHIRHCWRMNSLCASACYPGGGAWCFNPHSPLLANEFACTGCPCGLPVSFNPHSPLLANELRLDRVANMVCQVSIHIRHCWRMNSCARSTSHCPTRFQSTFAIAGE